MAVPRGRPKGVAGGSELPPLLRGGAEAHEAPYKDVPATAGGIYLIVQDIYSVFHLKSIF